MLFLILFSLLVHYMLMPPMLLSTPAELAPNTTTADNHNPNIINDNVVSRGNVEEEYREATFCINQR